jgi:hypothetical protein
VRHHAHVFEAHWKARASLERKRGRWELCACQKSFFRRSRSL